MEMEASAMKHLDLAAAERHAFRRPQQKVRADRTGRVSVNQAKTGAAGLQAALHRGLASPVRGEEAVKKRQQHDRTAWRRLGLALIPPVTRLKQRAARLLSVKHTCLNHVLATEQHRL